MPKRKTKPVPEGCMVIYRPWITLKSGKRLHAKACGKKAFRLVVKIKRLVKK